MAEKKTEQAYKQRIRIRLKSYDHRIIDAAAKQIIDTVERTGARTIGPIPLPTDRIVETVLRSPHVHKDSREQFEMRIHKRLIDVYDPATNTLDNLMHLDIPAGVDVEMKT